MSEEKKNKGWSRRKFLVRSATGLGVIIGTGYMTKSIWRRYLAQFANSIEPPYLGSSNDPSLWFEITVTNKVILHSTKVEMGQGTHTGLAQIAAEELGASMEQMQIKHASSLSGHVDMFGTGGSTSISSLWVPLREIAATMREMIRHEAAKIMETSPDQIQIANGIVADGKNSFTFGEIAQQVAEWEEVDTPQLKPIKNPKFIGHALPRVDLQSKVNGEPIYGMDAEMPDMLYGAVLRSNKVDAQLASADLSVAKTMPGVVQIVEEDDFIGVIAKSFTEAEKAKSAIKAEWVANQEWNYSDVTDMIEVGKGKAQTIQKNGNPNELLEKSNELIISEFQSPMGAHAQIEPNGAVAYVEDEQATIIMSTQVVEITRKEIAKRLGFSKSQVNIKPTFLGGGFGRRLHTPNAIEAALMSKAVGKPVKSFLSRQEEFQHDTFRPPTHHRLRASLDERGMIEAIEHHVSSGDVSYGSPLLPGFVNNLMGSDLGAWRGAMLQYSSIPNYQAVSWRVKLPFATSWWRSLGLLANTFAIESFMDELAEKAGQDPIDFRLAQIDDSVAGRRLKNVIKKVRDQSNWGGPIAEDRALGFACSTDVNVPCAQVVEASLENDQIKVHKVICAMDPGLVINPDQVRAQCEGAIIMGLSAAMFEKMTLKSNVLQPTIYGPYKMAMMRDAPKEIEVHLIQGIDKPQGVGEPPLGPIAAAIANAGYHLKGRRLRSMPLMDA